MCWQLLIERSIIGNTLEFSCADDSARFLACEHRRAAPTDALRSVDAFASWLKENHNTGTAITACLPSSKKAKNAKKDIAEEKENAGNHAGQEPTVDDHDLCLFASMRCHKADDLKRSLKTLLSGLGLTEAAARLPHLQPKYSWCHLFSSFKALVGEHAFFGGKGSAAIPIQIVCNKAARAPPNPFTASLTAKLEASNGARTFLLVSRSEDDISSSDDEKGGETAWPPISEATHHVLWLPACFNKDRKRISAHIHGGKGETSYIQGRMQKVYIWKFNDPPPPPPNRKKKKKKR